ncbi:MAG: DeoR/GlpR family DNA-binding transcription regulator [Spirochaetia bacterium]|nr:DeoR/GlpR family DNA-binding transcription regulator [Spirochaetia bacterium]
MLQPERLEKVRSLIEQHKSIKVSELSTACGVSENTIRRDLIELEEIGYCCRTKGGATLIQRGSDMKLFTHRLERHRECKRMIAREAAHLVTSGTTVILDSGTTAVEVAEELQGAQHVTIITPSLAASYLLAEIPEITLILPGGIVNHSSRSLTGRPAEQFFRDIHADILFLAVKAVSIENGLSDHTIAESSVKQQMIRAAERIYVLADHSKLDRSALSTICPIESIDALITDDQADPQFVTALRALGIEVIIAAALD